MIRKLLLPALLVGLLGGCVTEYGYRDGYYYGQPSVEYRYHDYGYPYGYYPYYQYGYYPYGYYPYRGPYRYYNYNYYPYYRYGYPRYHNRDHRRWRPPVTGTPGTQPPGPDTDDRDHNLPIWRDPSRGRRGEAGSNGGAPNLPIWRDPSRGRRTETPSGGPRRAYTPPPMQPTARPEPGSPVIRQTPRGEARGGVRIDQVLRRAPQGKRGKSEQHEP